MSDWNVDAINKSHINPYVSEAVSSSNKTDVHHLNYIVARRHAAIECEYANDCWIDAIDIRKCFPTRLVESSNRYLCNQKWHLNRCESLRHEETHIDMIVKCMGYVQFLSCITFHRLIASVDSISNVWFYRLHWHLIVVSCCCCFFFSCCSN